MRLENLVNQTRRKTHKVYRLIYRLSRCSRRKLYLIAEPAVNMTNTIGAKVYSVLGERTITIPGISDSETDFVQFSELFISVELCLLVLKLAVMLLV